MYVCIYIYIYTCMLSIYIVFIVRAYMRMCRHTYTRYTAIASSVEG